MTENQFSNQECALDKTDELMTSETTEWELIDNLVMEYQQIYREDINKTDKIVEESKKAAEILINKFFPLFKKYTIVLRTGQINFENAEQKFFVMLFMDSPYLKKILCGKAPIPRETRAIIYQKFNFVKETYGHLEEPEIMTDLYQLFLTLAKRYKKKSRSFCCYVYNSFRYEVYRHIQKFTRNPLNIHYKNIGYEDCNEKSSQEVKMEIDIEDKIYETENGLPDLTWISGESCSDIFSDLTPFERKLLITYYMQKYNDKQIADMTKSHINTCNQRRRNSIKKIALKLGVNPNLAKRSRNSGKQAEEYNI